MTAHETNEGGQGQAEGGGDSRAARTHLSAAGLRARGWTVGMVRQLLGEPDLLRANPHVRSSPPTRLYCVERVEAAERNDTFRTVAAAAARRSAAARVIAQRRRREVLARITAESIDVPRLAPDKLAALAVEHHNRGDKERSHERSGPKPQPSPPATVESADPLALDRWKVDYLRHRLTRYDELLNGLYGSTGRATAEELLRRRLYAAIAEAYPLLAQECARRLAAVRR
ncbi:hypothetical protein [Streptomyces sp. STR69]|uniref:hypothetical protein n=1 Tax=Streptomyces sp. STR69 TaxID=1796942 RepID=UPI0021C5B1A9|nr:hypothetical protein [Streptomyces sp. STR69]